MEQTDMLKLELELQTSIAETKTTLSDKLLKEMKPLKEMLVTARKHFKSVESSNFEALSN
jgi:hypothetical protein